MRQMDLNHRTAANPLRIDWRSSAMTLAILVIVAFTFAGVSSAAQINLEARRSLRTSISVTTVQYCSTPVADVDVLVLSLEVAIANLGAKPIIVPRGPYSLPCFAVARNEAELQANRYELNSCQSVLIDDPDMAIVGGRPRPFNDAKYAVIAPGETYCSTGELLMSVSRRPPLEEAPAVAPARFCACHNVTIDFEGAEQLDEPFPVHGREYAEARLLSSGKHVVIAEVFIAVPFDLERKLPADWAARGILANLLPFTQPMEFTVAEDRKSVDCK